MSRVLRFGLALLAASPISAADSAPMAVVTHFLSLAQGPDWGAAAAMLTADAQFGVNDVGGPLNAEALRSLSVFYKTCAKRDAVEIPRPTYEQSDARFVETRWDCRDHDGSSTHQLKITYIVLGDKIAGFWVR